MSETGGRANRHHGDAFDQLRLGDQPAQPDRRFAAGLRARIVAALDASSLPTVSMPERSIAVADTTTPTVTASIVPYICVGDAAGALSWYADVLGAVELVRYTGDDGRIGHAEMSIGGATFMLSDEYPDFGAVAPTTLGGTPLAMHLTVPDVDAVHARVVAAGATVDRPPADEAYGARSMTMRDPFGHRWMIQTPTGTPSTEEIESGMPGYTITAAAPPVEIGYVTFASPDTAVASRFYGELFGWASEPGNSGDEYAHVGNTKLPMGLTPGSVDEAPDVYFRVDDIARYTARVRELGGEVLSETTYDSGPNAVCRDVQGRRFQLWQPAPGYE
jgi:uncharacterized glyoxalase superfamily protein PhnB